MTITLNGKYKLNQLTKNKYYQQNLYFMEHATFIWKWKIHYLIIITDNKIDINTFNAVFVRECPVTNLTTLLPF